MTISSVQQAIDDFLDKKIQVTIEQKQKKLKASFTEEDAQKIRDDYKPFNWINKVVENIDELFLNVSHVAKLTHSSNQAISLKDNSESTDYPYLITTQTIGTEYLDSGYSDARYSPITQFLSYPVANSDKQLGEYLAENEAYFSKISDNKAERLYWSEEIQKAYQPKQIRSHTLAKQIYMPLGNDDYHLVSPMYSSSLAHKIYLSIKEVHDKENPIKKARKAKQWHEGTYIYYPNVATLGITKSMHQNASALNNTRKGLLYLFPALPPQWRVNPNPPTTMKQLFNQTYPKQALEHIRSLLYILNKKELFINYDRKQALKDSVEDIVAQVCDAMLLIRQTQASGWTASKDMPMYLRLFMDKDVLANNQFSQPEIKAYLNEMSAKLAGLISDGIKDTARTTKLENLWIKIATPILQNLYQTLKAE